MAGQTLKVAKLELEQKLRDAFFNAGFNAYMTQHQPNAVSEAQKYDNVGKDQMKKLANDYAEELSKSLAKDMAEAIYNFVKEIGIQVTIPPSVIAPSGPCTGVIPLTSFTII